ncbi:hypothetical protein E5288_WYG022145 [Bos mutus]|uniref:Uncharacterized protein n=1 Tax=Bos mutus TaxID=72004 RepID=A0A6B0RLQ1_9CETA|nr:hypothetical protein [Bos mutus]
MLCNYCGQDAVTTELVQDVCLLLIVIITMKKIVRSNGKEDNFEPWHHISESTYRYDPLAGHGVFKTCKYVVICPHEKPYSPSSPHLSGPPGLSNALIPLIEREQTQSL